MGLVTLDFLTTELQFAEQLHSGRDRMVERAREEAESPP
jgi:hypothetical protein